MGWVVHGKKRYFYRSRRIAGRAVNEYVGSGLVGEAAASAIAQRRAHRTAEAENCRVELARLDAAAEPLMVLCSGADLLSRAALVLAGYHQHDRGEWRRRRNGKHTHDQTG